MTKVLGGRPVQPAALALLIAALVEALTLLPGTPWHGQYHPHSDDPLSLWLTHAVGAGAAVIAVLFVIAWLRGSHRCLDRALQGSTLLWVWAAVAGIVQGAALGRTMLAVAWAVLAAGSAWLEEGDDE